MSSKLKDNNTEISKETNYDFKYNFYLNEDIQRNIIEAGKLAIRANNQLAVTAASLNLHNLQPIMNSVSQAVASYQRVMNDNLIRSVETVNKMNETFNRINTERLNQLMKSMQTTVFHMTKHLDPIYDLLRKNYEWINEINITEEDLDYAIDVIENDKLDTFVEQELPTKEKEELSNKERSLFVRAKLVIDILTIVFSIIFPPYEINVTTIQENYNINIENAVFQSDREGVKWLDDQMAKEHLEQNYRIVMKDDLTVRTEKRKKSHIAGTLHKGYIVQIIKKERNWSYVMFSDAENGDLFSGWTNTKHLKSVGNKN